LSPRVAVRAYHCVARYGYAWVCLDEPLAPIIDADEEHDPTYRRIPQFYEVWNTSAFRLMENSFDNAHFAFVHKGTFGQLNQPLPEKYEITETDYGFEAETLITVANPPVQHRISGTTEPTTKRHMRNKWYMPFCRKLDIEYPSGLRHIIFNSATPIDDSHIMVVQWLYRNDSEADCPAKELVLKNFNDAIDMVVATLEKQSEADWTTTYSSKGLEDAGDRFTAVLRCAAHVSQHVGQIIYLCKEMARQSEHVP